MLPPSPRYLDDSRVHPSPSCPALLSHASCRLSRSAPLSPGGALAVLLTTGCAGGADAGTEFFPDFPWTLDGPEVRIGSLDDPDYLFGLVGAVVPGPDGFVYSLHPRDAVVRRWTADGTPAGTMGRPGQGPGEFTQPGRMGFFGDSLWVMDSGLNRASYFDLAGEFLGSVSPDISLVGPNGRAVRPSYPLRDGTFAARPGAGSLQIATGELTENPLMRVDAEGNALGTIWLEPYKPLDLLALLDERGRGGMFSIQAFRDAPLSAPLEHGLLVVDRAAWTGTGPATIGVTRIDLAGDTMFARSFPYDACASGLGTRGFRCSRHYRKVAQLFRGRHPRGDLPPFPPATSGRNHGGKGRDDLAATLRPHHVRRGRRGVRVVGTGRRRPSAGACRDACATAPPDDPVRRRCGASSATNSMSSTSCATGS